MVLYTILVYVSVSTLCLGDGKCCCSVSKGLVITVMLYLHKVLVKLLVIP